MLDGLNPPQREAVTHPGGPLLVIAGAGSGKTRVLTTRIAWLMHERAVRPDRILAFTFTNKAAREMQNRVAKQTAGSGAVSWIGTFHATGVKILRREAARIGYDRWFTIFDADDARTLAKKLIKDLNADPKQFTPRSVISQISRYKNDMVSPEQAQILANTGHEEKAVELYAAYTAQLKQMGAMDFDDLIGKTVELFETCRDVQERYAEQFEHVLVDEFQDTNPMQLVMIRALSATHGNLCAVGDDDQSIYSWRGATVDNMLNFEEYFRGADVVRLEQNYRSTSVILRAANEVIAHNRRRKGKNLWSERDGGLPLELWWSEDEEEEAAQIRDRIRRILSETDASRKHIVILYRTNAQSRSIEDSLRRENLPYQIIGGTRFYDRKEVRDMLAYLKVILNPADRINLARILNVPKRALGKTTADRFFAALELRGGSALDFFADIGALQSACGNAAAKRLNAFGKIIAQLRLLSENGDVAKVVRQLVQATEYAKYLEHDDPATADDRKLNVEEFVNAAHEFVAESDDPSLGAFLESVALLADADRIEDTTDVITLMTVHTAKGLEYPYVFVAGCEDGLLPHASTFDEDEGVEEERRLFYVALTRAEEQVFLMSAGRRRRFGTYENSIPSRFLDEVPEDCLAEMSIRSEPRVVSSERAFGYGSRSWTPGAPTAPPRKKKKRQDHIDTTDAMSAAQAFLNSRAKKIASASDLPAFDDHEISQDEVVYQVGMRVQHELLGEGVIEDVEGEGALMRITIRFGDAGRKRLIAQHARLILLGEES